MRITRNTMETAVEPGEWFAGTVYIDTVAAPSGTSRLGEVPSRSMTRGEG